MSHLQFIKRWGRLSRFSSDNFYSLPFSTLLLGFGQGSWRLASNTLLFDFQLSLLSFLLTMLEWRNCITGRAIGRLRLLKCSMPTWAMDDCTNIHPSNFEIPFQTSILRVLSMQASIWYVWCTDLKLQLSSMFFQFPLAACIDVCPANRKARTASPPFGFSLGSKI